jgi:uncharacterized membrane protein HdeD (DUF308 family)
MKNKDYYLRFFCLIYLLYIPISIILTWNDIAALFLVVIIPITLILSGTIYYISGLKKDKTVNIIYGVLMIIQLLLFGLYFYSSMKNMILMLSVIVISSSVSKIIVYCFRKKDLIISFWGLNFNLFLILFPTIGIILENFDWFHFN